MPESIVSYIPHLDATPEVESAVLANVYRFILDTSNKKAGVNGSGEDDAKKGSDDDRATAILPRR